MEKLRRYEHTRFPPEVLRQASERLRRDHMTRIEADDELDVHFILECSVDEDTKWKYDSADEFFADYRREPLDATYCEFLSANANAAAANLTVWYSDRMDRMSRVSVEASSREEIEAVFEIFEVALERSRLPEVAAEVETKFDTPVATKVFIGHGRSPLWRDLKDHLQDQFGYDIQAYEVGSRAGHTIRDVLQQMLDESTFAILVMTGEDETVENELHPRLNVVHELGLFQARLGFNRAIAVLEEGTQEFSNIYGIQQIRFSRGNIREIFGDVLAVLRREFPPSA